METQESQLIKLQVCLYKHDDTSYEDFTKYATEEYPMRAIPLSTYDSFMNQLTKSWQLDTIL